MQLIFLMFQIFELMILIIIIFMFVSVTIRHRKAKKLSFKRIIIFFSDFVSAGSYPIKLQYRLIVAKVSKRMMIERNDLTYSTIYKKNSETILKIQKKIKRHIRLHQSFETIYQLAITSILICYDLTPHTNTSQGLSAFFEGKNLKLIGIPITPKLLVEISAALGFLSFTLKTIQGIRIKGSYLPITPRILLALSILCSCVARISSMVLYFAPTLGLFHLLFHYKGKKYLMVILTVLNIFQFCSQLKQLGLKCLKIQTLMELHTLVLL